jgi:transposase
MFYDSSILCESNYKNYAWTLENNNNQKQSFPINKIFGSASILMACTTKKIINFWISTKCNKVTTTSFLYETILKYRKEEKNKILVIFLDNATMHYSQEMTLLAQKLGVYLFFNAPYSSKINLIEYVFEKIKRNIRKKTEKKGRMVLKDVLFREMRNFIMNEPEIRTEQFFKELHKALQFKNMWSTVVKNKQESFDLGTRD